MKSIISHWLFFYCVERRSLKKPHGWADERRLGLVVEPAWTTPASKSDPRGQTLTLG